MKSMRLIFQKMIRMGNWKLIESSKLDPYECLTLSEPDDVIDFIEFKNKKPLTQTEKQHIFNQIKEGHETGEIND
jgi:hypothetical protein